MKILSTFAAAGVVLCLAAASAFAATSEVMDVDPEIMAKIAKEKSKKIREGDRENKRGRHYAVSTPQECGSVNIGQVNEPRGFLGRPVNVVVVGDVINANNRCR